MPKGKARKNNPGLYEEGVKSRQSNTAPQASAHRRGGVHRVKDGDRTDSIYDQFDYRRLLQEAKDRKLYRKDMKKVEMARALRDDDSEKNRAERYAIIERKRKEKEEKKEQQQRADELQRQAIAKQEWKVEKEQRRKRGESVSDDTNSNNEMEAGRERIAGINEYMPQEFGQPLSDESWDSTSTESTTKSTDQLINPSCKLRIFEWPYAQMPPMHVPGISQSSSGSQSHEDSPETLPLEIPYAPIKVVTTNTKQKLFLPGQSYPAGVFPDFVPPLPLEDRSAVRNGILQGVLRNAVIEKATEWAERTQIQGWNARMYFNSCSHNESRDLMNTYEKWSLENRKLLRVRGHRVAKKRKRDNEPTDREKRYMQRNKNKSRKAFEVYEASQHRPLAICYLPAYLDFTLGLDGGQVQHKEKRHSLENLFFIRFPSCDVPHYYFWTQFGAWADPTIPNPGWNPAMMQEEQAAEATKSEVSEQEDAGQDLIKLKQKYSPKSSNSPSITWVRVKKTNAVALSPLSPSSPKMFADSLAQIEYELFTNGIVSTLSKYRRKWMANGKQDNWNVFASAITTLFPSGRMPETPPVDMNPKSVIAVKLALIDDLKVGQQTLPSPLRGDESWTRNDDKFWDVIEQRERSQNGQRLDRNVGLCRGDSITSCDSLGELGAWLDQVSPSFLPPTWTCTPPSTPLGV